MQRDERRRNETRLTDSREVAENDVLEKKISQVYTDLVLLVSEIFQTRVDQKQRNSPLHEFMLACSGLFTLTRNWVFKF